MINDIINIYQLSSVFLDALQPGAAVVVFVLPLPSDHGPGPAVDDVGPPRLRGGVAPGVVESPPYFLRFYKHLPHYAHLCALCSLQQKRGRPWRGSGQHHLSSSRGDLEDDIAI